MGIFANYRKIAESLRAVVLATACTLAMLWGTPGAQASDAEEANRLIVQSVKLYYEARDSEDLSLQVSNLDRILENLERIVDVHSGSPHAVTLVTGGEVGGLSISAIAEQLAAVEAQIMLARLSAPGTAYDYQAPPAYMALLYDASEGDPFISMIVGVEGMRSEYWSADAKSSVEERWTAVCWDYLGEEGDWSQTQVYQFDCRQMFPATIGQEFQIVSETTTMTGDRWSSVWNVEVGFYGISELFGRQVSFAGVTERVTRQGRERAYQEHVYSVDTGLVTRLQSGGDPDTGMGGLTVEVVDYFQAASLASLEVLGRCARANTGLEPLRRCLCGANVVEQTLRPEQLERFASILRSNSESAPENAGFLMEIARVQAAVDAQCPTQPAQ